MPAGIGRRRARIVALAVVAATAAVSPVFAWGHSGHQIVNAIAIDLLPAGPLKTFFAKHRDWMVEHSVDPDVYKQKHHAEEGPRHFLNIDENGIKPEEYPHAWKTVVERLGLHDATKQGKLPWTIDEFEADLVLAFKAKDGTKIIEKATWLGHYVGDAHVPFHACANHDGQLSGQRGIHAIWEENMIAHNRDEVEALARKLAASMKVAEVQGSVVDWSFTRIIAGDKLAHAILAQDKGTRSSAREKALYKATGAVAAKRLAEAGSGLASLWLTAWTRAGKPALPVEAKLSTEPAPKDGGDDGERDRGGDTAKGDAPKERPEPETPAKPEPPARPEEPGEKP